VSAPLPPSHLRDRVLEAVKREPVPTRDAGDRRRTRAVVIGFGVLLLTTILIARSHGRPTGYIVAVTLAWTPVAALATWAGVSRGRSMLGRPAPWLAAVVALTPVALMVAWTGIALAWPAMLHDSAGPGQHLICNVMTLLLSIGPLLAFGRLWRRGEPVNPRLKGAAIGTAAAAWGAVSLHLICAFTRPFHILVGHVAPVLLVAAIGALLTARTVAVRSQTG
jgi:hypothetical protein